MNNQGQQNQRKSRGSRSKTKTANSGNSPKRSNQKVNDDDEQRTHKNASYAALKRGRSYRTQHQQQSSPYMAQLVLIISISTLFVAITSIASSFRIIPTPTSHYYSDVFVRADGSIPLINGNNVVPRTKPSLCNDGVTYGYSDWNSLRSAIMEINSSPTTTGGGGIAGSTSPTTPSATVPVNDGSEWVLDEDGIALPYTPPPPPNPFIICPGVTIRGRNRKGAIFVDSEDIVIECDSCTIDLGGTHLSFGSNAKGIVVRGVTFMGAKSSSLTFHHHGAEAVFEDCVWIGNSGMNNAGAVADLNSTSSVSFFRCEISDSKQMPRVVGYGNPGVSSSLTIRN